MRLAKTDDARTEIATVRDALPKSKPGRKPPLWPTWTYSRHMPSMSPELRRDIKRLADEVIGRLLDRALIHPERGSEQPHG